MLFKFGSGTGSNLSCLRGSHEGLSAGGTASGPLSFMKGFDSFAGAIKSGGKTRRAAKMVILNIDHPDIEDFILSKANEEKKAWALIDAGYDGSFNGEAYASIFYQNANHSVRVTDEFMHAVENDGEWWTKEVLTGQPLQEVPGAGPDGARSPTPRGSAATPACSTTRRSTAGTRSRRRTGSTRRTRAPSTCSWTTPRATSRR